MLTCHRSVAYSFLHATGGVDGWEPGGDFAGDFGFDGVEDFGGDGALCMVMGLRGGLSRLSDEALQINQGTIYARWCG